MMDRFGWTLGLALALAAAGCDGGEVDVDASTGTTDSGVSTGDAQTPEPDAGTTDPDGGTTDPDGGTSDPDGGTTDPDAGPPVLSCEMGSIRIAETCPAFAACGGDQVGMWCYADVCMTKRELIEPVIMQAQSLGQIPDCRVEDVIIRGSMGTIDGTVNLTTDMLTRTVMSSATGTFFLPPDCILFPGPGARRCNATEAAINEGLGANGSGTCMPDADGCECDITFDSMVNESDTYTLEGNTIVTGAGRRYDYCVEGDGNFRFREDASMRSGSGEPGTQTLLPLSP